MTNRVEIGQTYTLARSLDGFRKGAAVTAVGFDPDLGILVRSSWRAKSTHVSPADLEVA